MASALDDSRKHSTQTSAESQGEAADYNMFPSEMDNQLETEYKNAGRTQRILRGTKAQVKFAFVKLTYPVKGKS